MQDVVDQLAERLGVSGGCDEDALSVALLRLLARGEPVVDTTLAASVGRPAPDVEVALRDWANVRRDVEGRVIAYGGLSLLPTKHRFEVDGHVLFTWCAWDALFLPAKLDRTATVLSHCPVTGEEVRLVVEPDRVSEAWPADVGVSFPKPDAVDCSDIVASFCCHVHLLAGDAPAERWRHDHDGAVVLGIDQAFALGRRATRRLPG